MKGWHSDCTTDHCDVSWHKKSRIYPSLHSLLISFKNVLRQERTVVAIILFSLQISRAFDKSLRIYFWYCGHCQSYLTACTCSNKIGKRSQQLQIHCWWHWWCTQISIFLLVLYGPTGIYQTRSNVIRHAMFCKCAPAKSVKSILLYRTKSA